MSVSVDHKGSKIQRPRIEVLDEDGDEMRFSASDVFVVRDIFKCPASYRPGLETEFEKDNEEVNWQAP